MKADEIKETLEQFDGRWVKLQFALSVGLFLSLFMIAFQPFGVSNFDPGFRISVQFVVIMLVFGLLVAVVLWLGEALIRPRFLTGRSIRALPLWLVWVYFLTGSSAYLLYNMLGNWHDLSWSSYFGFIRDVGMVITFPIAGYLFYLHYRVVRARYVNLQSTPPVNRERAELSGPLRFGH